MRAHHQKRRGLALIMALVVLMLTTAVAAALIRAGGMRRRLQALDRHEVQARVIAHAAWGRAAARLAGADTYKGETWEITAADLGGEEAASAVITVEPVEGKADRRLVVIIAEYPRGGATAARSQVRGTLTLKTKGPGDAR